MQDVRDKDIISKIRQACGKADTEFMCWARKHTTYLDQLFSTGYNLVIRGGPPISHITYVKLDDPSVTAIQTVFRNEYLMQRDANTIVELMHGLAYSCLVPVEELTKQYRPQAIKDPSLRIDRSLNNASRVDYLLNKYKATEPAFAEHLIACREFLEPILDKAFKEGCGVKVLLNKLDVCRMFRLKPQYSQFAKHNKWSVVINGKLEELAVQILARKCEKTYVIIGDDKLETIFKTEGYASLYDKYLTGYYNMVE